MAFKTDDSQGNTDAVLDQFVGGLADGGNGPITRAQAIFDYHATAVKKHVERRDERRSNVGLLFPVGFHSCRAASRFLVFFCRAMDLRAALGVILWPWVPRPRSVGQFVGAISAD